MFICINECILENDIINQLFRFKYVSESKQQSELQVCTFNFIYRNIVNMRNIFCRYCNNILRCAILKKKSITQDLVACSRIT